MNCNNILLPWQIWDRRIEGVWCSRKTFNNKEVRIACWASCNYNGKIWSYAASNLYGIVIDYHNKHIANSLEDAQKYVDDMLIKAGWRLLDKENKLMVLV